MKKSGAEKAGYVDGFVIVVPKKNRAAYKKIASQAGKVWMKYGALEYVESIGDDMNPEWTKRTFPKLAGVKPDEDVWFSFITFKSKAHRNEVNKNVMKDPFMNPEKMPVMPFDMKKMSYGGFKVVVNS